jgi:hypothetical protein
MDINSQIQGSDESACMQVCSVAKVMPCTINRQVMMALLSLGLDENILWRKYLEHVEDLDHLLEGGEEAVMVHTLHAYHHFNSYLKSYFRSVHPNSVKLETWDRRTEALGKAKRVLAELPPRLMHNHSAGTEEAVPYLLPSCERHA